MGRVLYGRPLAEIEMRCTMKMKVTTPLAMVSVLVGDQDEALRFYTEKLGLEKRTDVTYGPGLRWVTVAARGQEKPEIALAKPDRSLHSEEQIKALLERVGQGTPWIFETSDCRETYETLLARGVKFLRAPTLQLYGVEAVLTDPYGNTFSLLEAAPEVRSLVAYRRIGSAA